MKRLFEWLFDLDAIRIGRDAPLSVHWELPVPAWVLLAFILIAMAGIVTVYWRERISLARRIVLSTVRLGLIALLLGALCHPSLVLQRNRVEPAYVALVIDQSLSMSSKDRQGAGDSAELVGVVGADDPQKVDDMSRLEIAVAAFVRNGQAALKQLLLHNGIKLVTFASTAETVAFLSKGETPETIAKSLQSIVPDGPATDLSAALNAVLNRTQGRRLAAIVLASDGRLTSAAQLEELLHVAADKQVPIYPIRIGSTMKEVDLEISSIKAQSVAFANDFLLVEAAISASGLEKPIECTVQLVDDQTGEVVDEKKIILDTTDQATKVELSAKPAHEGDARYRVRVEPLPGERHVENNQDVIDTRVLADRLKVLYVEAYPRFEYRFLKNALLREKSIELSVLLLEADDNFVQEGAEPIRRFPETAEELARFHVVLFGDVDPNEGWLTPAQVTMLLDFVGQRGGGFGLVAGVRNAPHKFVGTPLERLIPVNVDPQVAGSTTTSTMKSFKPQFTTAGQESRLLRFLNDPQDNEQTVSAFPELFWVSHTLGSKPGASVLLEDPERSTAMGPMPLIVLGRYGAGKLFFQATDDTWRWRRHTGELLYDGYWVRVMRELMNSSLSSAGRRYVIRTDRRIYPYGKPVRAQIEILDPRLISEDQSVIKLRAAHLEDSKEEQPPGVAENGIHAQRLAPQSNVFEGNFLPSAPGTFTVTAPDISASGGGRSASAIFRVEKPDLEMLHREADHENLLRIASTTGGKLLELNELETQLGEIRDRSVQIPDDITESLWDSRLVFVLFLLMISIEWGLRKVFGLL